jgi:membrane protein YqaA with SNARE-associated domain
MKPKPKSKSDKSRWQLLHQYYNYTGFYQFVWRAIKRALPILLLIIAAVYVVNHYYDINETLVRLTETLPVYGVLAFFLASESLVLGIIPPEIFIAWAGKMPYPWLFLSILALLSYAGGLIAFYMGRFITKIPSVHRYLEQKMEKQLQNARKWGGFLIIVGALLPLPFAISCLTAGIIDFPFKNVMVYGSLRLLRFLIYGLIIFNVF